MSSDTKFNSGWMKFYSKDTGSIDCFAPDPLRKCINKSSLSRVCGGEKSKGNVVDKQEDFDLKLLILILKGTIIGLTVFRIPALMNRYRIIRKMWKEWSERLAKLTESENANESLATFDRLPAEIKLEILFRLDIHSLLTLSQSTSRWHRLISGDSVLWRHLIQRDFPATAALSTVTYMFASKLTFSRQVYRINAMRRRAALEYYHYCDCTTTSGNSFVNTEGSAASPWSHRASIGRYLPLATSLREAVEFEFDIAVDGLLSLILIGLRLAVAALLFPVYWLLCWLQMPHRLLNNVSSLMLVLTGGFFLRLGSSSVSRAAETETTIGRVIRDLLFQSHIHYLNIRLFRPVIWRSRRISSSNDLNDSCCHYYTGRCVRTGWTISQQDSSLLMMLVNVGLTIPLVSMNLLGTLVFQLIHRPLLWLSMPPNASSYCLATTGDLDRLILRTFLLLCSVFKLAVTVCCLLYTHYTLIITLPSLITKQYYSPGWTVMERLFCTLTIFLAANEQSLLYINQSLLARLKAANSEYYAMVDTGTFHLLWALLSIENWLVNLSKACLSTVISLVLLGLTMLSVWPAY